MPVFTAGGGVEIGSGAISGSASSESSAKSRDDAASPDAAPLGLRVFRPELPPSREAGMDTRLRFCSSATILPSVNMSFSNVSASPLPRRRR